MHPEQIGAIKPLLLYNNDAGAMTIFYSPTLVAQQKERQINEKLGTT